MLNHLLFSDFNIGGERGIRTLGGLLPGGFQDRCLKPLDHFSVIYIICARNGGFSSAFRAGADYFSAESALPPAPSPCNSRLVTSFANAAGSGSGLPSVSSDWSNSTFA